MKVTTFENEKELVASVTKSAAKIIKASIKSNGDARILLSGGSTPGPIYEALSNQNLSWKDVKVGLADERFVRTTNAYSNENLIQQTLVQNKAKDAQVKGMIFNPLNEEENVKTVASAYTPFTERTDFLLLGMGTDGHTASLFPNDPSSEDDLNKQTIGAVNTVAPNEPKHRISCTKGTLTQASNIFLVIKGENKLDVLNNGDEKLPIHRMLKERSDIEIYYCKS
ncbi:MAG: 6-phosphogluconolactonase [Fluviicola sp. XM-24bin1]|nr:MAG: 6-phosphogluconolactonase [Fluviicola sp. XM-24bin1]